MKKEKRPGKQPETNSNKKVKLNMTFEQAMKKALNTKLPKEELTKKPKKK